MACPLFGPHFLWLCTFGFPRLCTSFPLFNSVSTWFGVRSLVGLGSRSWSRFSVTGWRSFSFTCFAIQCLIGAASCHWSPYEMCCFWTILDVRRLSDQKRNTQQSQTCEMRSKVYKLNIHCDWTPLRISRSVAIAQLRIVSFLLSVIGSGLLRSGIRPRHMSWAELRRWIPSTKYGASERFNRRLPSKKPLKISPKQLRTASLESSSTCLMPWQVEVVWVGVWHMQAENVHKQASNKLFWRQCANKIEEREKHISSQYISLLKAYALGTRGS